MKTIKTNTRERGNAMVEGAISFFVVAVLLIGVVDFGQFLYIHQTLTERARAAVRYGSVNDPTDATSIQNVALYGQASGDSVPSSPTSSDQGIFNVRRSNIVVTATGIATDDYRLLVQIQNYNYTIYSPLVAGSYTGPNITASIPLGAEY